jgi:hypothetical protein
MFAALLLAIELASARAAPPGSQWPPRTRGLQGVDDDAMTQFASSLPDGGETLSLRYTNLASDISPGVRRYNFFWSGVENAVPPSDAPLACPAGHTLTPSSEAERAARGYNRFHCYLDAQLLRFDDVLARDAAIGAVSALIVYGSPDFARLPGCTGFPWPPNSNFTQGCLPWNNMHDWEDFINMIVERWRAPRGQGPRVDGLCIWNEIQSQGWSDPSPVLPNRFAGAPYTPAQMGLYAGAIANLTLLAGRAAARQNPDGVFLWLSTDHFLTPPPLRVGDVAHTGLRPFLDAFWPLVNLSVPWGVAVHPYDDGDPRHNLSASGIYTFATLREDVAAYQCRKLAEVARVPAADCWAWPQTAMWASEQGWPQGPHINKTLQARNICLAHGLSLAQGLWAVTHNLFQSVKPSQQGGSGDFSLVDEPPLIAANLSGAATAGRETYDAYRATAPGVWGLRADHYCCARWGEGCGP